MYYTHLGCQTSIFGENRAYCIRDFTAYIAILTQMVLLLTYSLQCTWFTHFGQIHSLFMITVEYRVILH